MQQIAKIKQDKSVRPRLIWACLCVALLVSAIYVTVSYRLTADITIRSELKAMGHITSLVSNELSQLKNQAIDAENVDTVLSEILLSAVNSPAFITVSTPQQQWHKNLLISSAKRSTLLQLVAEAEDNAEPIEVDGNTFLWQQHKIGQYQITFVQQTQALDVTLEFVAKRLLVTSIIVFWIAVWLALTLASLIARRAEQVNESLAYIATHDSLTGLPNRLYLIELLENSLGPATDDSDTPVDEGCLLIIDLDRFKDVNDSFGYAAGDTLLKEVARRVSELISAPAELIRTGGDEFFIWGPDYTIEQAKTLSLEIVNSCNSPILINGLTVNSGASIGISHYPSQADDTAGLIVCADTAMHKAKAMRSGWQVYDNKKIADYKDILQLRAELSDALAQQQIILYYQPKVDLATGEVTGAEALCRWQHPRLGLLGPGEFIDLIEHSGKVQEFGRYIIASAAAQAEQWYSDGLLVPIGINLSPYNLLDPGLAEFISETLKRHQIPPQFIEIELTENETCINIDYIQSALAQIRELGVSLAIDDFGTGMSSLAYLSELRVNVLKIDRAFICDLTTNQGHRAIIAAAVTLSQSFGCDMVAEGVETQEQARLLYDMGCRAAQGFLFARPMPAEAFRSLLTQQKPQFTDAF